MSRGPLSQAPRSTCAMAASTAMAQRPRRRAQSALRGQDDSRPLGQEFREEFNTDEKITEMIRSGSVIGKPPITSMPHWGGIILDDDLDALVAYLKTLEVGERTRDDGFCIGWLWWSPSSSWERSLA